MNRPVGADPLDALDGRYEEHVVYRAPHPNWGVSNLTAMDFDGDADVDFLLAHRDTLDDGLPFKFYHGVEWLENRGNAEFSAHRVGTLYGAHSAEEFTQSIDTPAIGNSSSIAPQRPANYNPIRTKLASGKWCPEPYEYSLLRCIVSSAWFRSPQLTFYHFRSGPDISG
jgi:hypothetical protein